MLIQGNSSTQNYDELKDSYSQGNFENLSKQRSPQKESKLNYQFKNKGQSQGPQSSIVQVVTKDSIK